MTKILIIESVKPLREAIADVLSEASFLTITAEDGVDGIEQAQQHGPDLILCDVDALHLDGYGVFAKLQSSPETAHIPFLLMTAPTEHLERSQRAPLDVDRLYKPFNVNQLINVVHARLSLVKP